ncbi:MAG: hypothetical protein Q9M40_01955 [Sulfurimonas sp.]|nr:hypothetical protein [Sulfurimonas sp.]
MRFLSYGDDGLKLVLNECTYQELVRFTKYVNDVAPGRLQITKINSTRKDALVKYLVELLKQDKNVVAIAKKLTSTPISRFLYTSIVWERTAFETEFVMQKFGVKFSKPEGNRYGINEEYLGGILSLILRATRSSSQFYITDELDILTMDRKIISLMKILLPIPDDYELLGVNTPAKTEFTYSNEEQVFNFISVASEMLKNNLVEFGKTGEKPLAKSLNILKASTRHQ